MPIKERKAIKVGQLIAILNQRIMRYAETKTCRVISVSPLATTNPDMCNWSSVVNWNPNGMNREVAMPIIRKQVMGAQKEFNLLPAGSE